MDAQYCIIYCSIAGLYISSDSEHNHITVIIGLLNKQDFSVKKNNTYNKKQWDVVTLIGLSSWVGN